MEIASVPDEYNPGHSFLVRDGLEAGAVSWGRVPVRPLDGFDFGRRVDLIKVDVEGAEAMVLGGGRALLRHDLPVLITEFFPAWLRKVSGVEPAAYLAMLREIGYRIYELTADGPGRSFDDLPAEAGKPGFFTNIVAHCEPRPFRVARPGAPAPVATAEAVIDTSPMGHSRLLSRLDAQVTALQAGLNPLVTRIKASLDAVAGRVAASEDSLAATLAKAQDALAARIRASQDAVAGRVAASEVSLATALTKTQEESYRAVIEALKVQDERHDLQNRQSAAALERLQGEVMRLAKAVGTPPRAVVSADSFQPLMVQLQHIGGQLIALSEQGRKRKKPLISRIFRELKRPFTRRFWERRREKRMLRRMARNAVIHAPIPHGLNTWSDVQRARAKVPALAGVEKPVVMIIDDRLPEPDRDSGSMDAMNMIASFVFAGWHVICAVHPKRHQDPGYTKRIEALGARRMSDADAPSVQAFVENHGAHVDAFVLSRVSAGGQFLELIRYNCPHAKIIFNTVDLHHVREARAARLAGDEAALARAERTRDREEFLVAKADMTLVVSSIENEMLQASLPGCATAVVPLSREVRHPGIPFEKRSGIGFIGGFQHGPNIDAITHFLRDVWPLVHARDASITLEIVGPDLPPDTMKDAQGPIRYRGALPEVEGWFDTLRMTVAPLRIGAGAKGKIASSLCNGLPAVISPVAAEGMDLEDGRSVFIAATPDEMAEAIVRLHKDPALWAAAAAAAEEAAERTLSIASYDRVLREALLRIELPVLAR
jgi:glycosyltransferase involved in cell wall biosynthesis